MDHDDDVERLFSWIKTPDLHYREFAADRDVADAWPVLRQDAYEAGHSEHHPQPEPEREAGPQGAGRPSRGERLAPLFGHREPAPEPEPPVIQPPKTRQTPPEETAGEVPWAAEAPRSPPAFARLEPTRRSPRPEPLSGPAPDRQYHGFEEPDGEPAAAEPADEGEGRSLDAIFSRLAHSPRTQPDGRKQATGGAGLGSVFRRLR